MENDNTTLRSLTAIATLFLSIQVPAWAFANTFLKCDVHALNNSNSFSAALGYTDDTSVLLNLTADQDDNFTVNGPFQLDSANSILVRVTNTDASGSWQIDLGNNCKFITSTKGTLFFSKEQKWGNDLVFSTLVGEKNVVVKCKAVSGHN